MLETKVYKAWNKDIKGDDVVIAVVDTGLNAELQEHLGDRVLSPYNVISENSDITDHSGHGTSVTCLIACDDFEKVYGIAPSANIMPIVAFDSSGRTSAEYLAKGIRYALTMFMSNLLGKASQHLSNIVSYIVTAISVIKIIIDVVLACLSGSLSIIIKTFISLILGLAWGRISDFTYSAGFHLLRKGLHKKRAYVEAKLKFSWRDPRIKYTLL